MRLTIIIELDADGYYAWCPELPGCQSQGDTLAEVIEHIGEAIQLYQETLNDGESPQRAAQDHMHPLESLRQKIDALLLAQPDDEERCCGYVHLYGVAQVAAMLALRRGLDPALATAAGMLHDIATYRTGDSRDHAPRSAAEARPMLVALGAFSEDEIAAICQAIAHHSLKGETHAPLDELLKDADVLQHYFYNVSLPVNPANRLRLERVLVELTPSPQRQATE